MSNEPYPPLTPLDQMALHGGGVDFSDDHWFACAQPERPRDNCVMYDWRCPACVLAGEAHIRNQGDLEMIWHYKAGDVGQQVLMSWQITRAHYWSSGGSQ